MISINASTRTCKVDTASAARIESDRFLNPNLVMCPNWEGRDLTGRQVCADSFYTKRAGCNSAADRVIVENNLRPAYFEYINLSAAGVRDDMYSNNMHYTDAGVNNVQEEFAMTKTGNFGLSPAFPGTNEATCSYGRYTEGQRQASSQISENRHRQGPMDAGANTNSVLKERYAPRNIQFQPTSKEASRINAAVTNGYRNQVMSARSGN